MALAQGGAQINIVNGLREFARSQPRVTAIIDGDRRMTYGELDERSSRLAQVFLRAGFAPGDSVAVLLGNCLEYLETVSALAKAGIVYVPLNPRSAVPEVEYILEHSDATGLVLHHDLAGVLPPSAQDLRLVLEIGGSDVGRPYEEALAAADAVDPLVAVSEDDHFCVTYTSGTTGRPKGVMLTHRGRVLTCITSALEFGMGVGRVNVAVAPIYHGAGFAFAYASIITGGTVSILRKWDPEAALALWERDRAGSCFLVPTHAQTIRSLGDAAVAARDLSALHTLYFNAAALPVVLKDWVMATFPHVGVHELYGSTEAANVTSLRPGDADRRGSVGHPWMMTEVRLVDESGAPVAPGQPGELFSRSPYLMKGYLKDPAATEACTTPDGFLSAGDVAVADEDGFISIVDRIKDMIVTGGVNVYPREVEELIAQVRGVREVAVVGMPDEKWGEQVTAFVVRETGAEVEVDALQQHLAPLLSDFKRPRDWRFLDALPRNAAGKVLKRDLRVAG